MRIVKGHDSAAIRTFTYRRVSPFPDDTLWRHCSESPLQQQCDPLADRNQRPTKKEKHQWPNYKNNHPKVRKQFVVHRSSLANCQLVSSVSQLPAVVAFLSCNRAVSFCCGSCRRACRDCLSSCRRRSSKRFGGQLLVGRWTRKPNSNHRHAF